MMPKSRIAAVYILLAVSLVGLVLWRLNATAPQGTVVSEGQAQVGGPFRLTDQYGKPRSDADFRGKLMLVYFGYSYCPDVCPISLGVMAEALEKLGKRADGVAPIFITVDPVRDTPKQLKLYMGAFGPRFVGLTGSRTELEKAAREYRVYAADIKLDGGARGVSHSDVIYLMDRNGKYLAHYQSADGPDAIAKDIEKRL